MTSSNKDVDNAFKHIVEQKSTQDLLRIYQYEYLNFQEEFVDLCEAELRRRKVDTGIKEKYYTLLPNEDIAKFIIDKLKKGKPVHDIIRILQHHHIITDHSEAVVQEAVNQYIKEKWDELIDESKVEITAGPILLAIGLLWYFSFPNITYWFLNWVSFTGWGIGMVLIGTIKLITFLIKRTIRFGFYPRKTKVASHVY